MYDLSHPDLRFLYQGYTADGTENVSGMIKTNDIRNAIAFTTMTPSSSHHRILILNDCHMIAPNGQNALLKTLEEPGKRTTLILTTHRPQSLLTTIKSRCIKVSLNVLSETDITHILQQKFPGTNADKIQFYAHIANGSAGDAVLYMENDALSIYHTLMEALYKNADAVYTLAAKVSDKKQPYLFDILCKLWQSFAAKIVRTHAQNIPLSMVMRSEYEALSHITQKYQHYNLLDWVTRISETLQDTNPPVYLDKKVVILIAFLPLHA